MNIENKRYPILLVISAPSGAGKTTLCERLAAEFSTITYSVSCTTRQPRVGEIDGKNYHFLTEEDFRRKQDQNAFLETAPVHGAWYGTLRETVVSALEKGRDVIMDLDVQGAANVRNYVASAEAGDPLKHSHADIFVAPPSLEDLQLRLFGRGKDAEDVINRRLDQAEDEMARWREFRYLVVNDRLDESYDALRAIFLAEHHRVLPEGAP